MRFLPSVTSSNYPDFEIIIADNASDDGSAAWVKSNYPECKVVTFDDNHGYCGGNNRAVKYATGNVLVFLNNDVETDPDWLTALDHTFTDQNTDIVQPKIRSVENRNSFEYAGASGGFLDWLGYPFCRGRLFDNVEEDRGQYNNPTEIFWASGAAFAVRKEWFMKTGGFDEDFEFHMEEIDLCWRSHRLGAKVMVNPESVVYHLGGGSLPMGSPRKVFYNYRNSLVMLAKNLEKAPFLKILLRLLLDGVAGVRSLIQGRPGETLAILKAHFSFYSRLPGILAKRKKLKNSAQKSVQHLMYPRLIIFQFFLKGFKTYRELTR